MQRNRKQSGQGMTEYIIIVALIAIAAIAAYSFFGQTLRSQVGGMATELSGGSAATAIGDAATSAGGATTEGQTATDLSTYNRQESAGAN